MPTVEVAGRLEFSPLQQSHGKGRILHDLFAREVPRRLDVDDGTRFAVGTLARTLLMLKLITLAACVIGFFFLGPKALAEFRQARSRTRTRLSDNAENKDTPDKPSSSAAA